MPGTAYTELSVLGCRCLSSDICISDRIAKRTGLMMVGDKERTDKRQSFKMGGDWRKDRVARFGNLEGLWKCGNVEMCTDRDIEEWLLQLWKYDD